MQLLHQSLSSAGPVRKKNEDAVGFWEPEGDEERQQRGAIAVMADGLGGHGNGEIASRMAVDTALQKFREAGISVQPRPLLEDIFRTANQAIHDVNLARRGVHMATTLTVCIFRDKQLSIGHVGDTRVYLVRHGQAQRITDDHSQTGWQMKLRLITEHEARDSAQRSMLTRSVGAEPMVRMDFNSIALLQHDRIVQCTDGVYAFINRGEIAEGVDRLTVGEICPYLVSLAERRNTDDNVSVQVVEVAQLEEARVHRPLSILKATSAGVAAMASHEVRPGQVLDSRFEIQEVVGRSGMASVFKAKDLQTGETVAVKVPHMQFESDPAFFSRFEREADIGKKLDHPNILRFISVPGQSRPYIVTEFLEGKTLADVMNEIRPFPIQDAVEIASLLCDALQHMHEKKIIHRDLKPQNIMVCNDGTLRIMDFGIAKSLEARRLTFAGFTTTMGTPDYMSPEQVKSRRGDARSDIYSLGAMLYEMTTGVVPFDGPNPFIVMNSRITGDPIAPRQRNPQISPELEEVILHAMERDPRERYPTVQAMKFELDNPGQVILRGRHLHLKRPNMWRTRWRGARLYVLAAGIPLLLFLLMFLLAHRHDKKKPVPPTPDAIRVPEPSRTGLH